MKLTKSQLQAALNSMAAAQNRVAEARNKIMAHCTAVYGVEPGDIDNDQYIDAMEVAGSSGMTADVFHQSMIDAGASVKG